MNERLDYTVDRTATPRSAVFTGVLRLESTKAYDAIFEPIRAEMLAPGARYTIDLSAVVFMNSSGIRALATLVLGAKAARMPLRIVTDARSPWQKKTVASLRLLYPPLELESVSDRP
jgi:hypothetical protein